MIAIAFGWVSLWMVVSVQTVASGGMRFSYPGLEDVLDGVTVADGPLNERGVSVTGAAIEGVLGLLGALAVLLSLFVLLLRPRPSVSKCLRQRSIITRDSTLAQQF